MRKNRELFLIIIGLCFIKNVYAQKLGDRVNKEIFVQNKNISLQMDFKEIIEYDKNGNMIRDEWVDGKNHFEKKYEYDKHGNKVKESLSEYRDQITEYKYDTKGNMTYKKTYIYDKKSKTFGNPTEYFYEYDKKGHKISWKMNNYIPTRYQYDTKGNLIFEDDPWNGGVKTYYEYDKYGDNIHKRAIFNNGNIIDYWYKYDSLGNKTYSESSNGDVTIYEYDVLGNKIHYKYKYNGVLTEVWYGWDDADIIWEVYNKNYVTWYEYVYNPDGSKIQYKYRGEIK